MEELGGGGKGKLIRKERKRKPARKRGPSEVEGSPGWRQGEKVGPVEISLVKPGIVG